MSWLHLFGLWVLLGPCLVAWCVWGLPLLTHPRAPSLPLELARAAFLASFPASGGLVAAAAVSLLGIEPELGFLLVPFPLALALGLAAVEMLVALAWRLRQPLEEPAPEPEPEARDRT